jgi:hypothetical protein
VTTPTKTRRTRARARKRRKPTSLATKPRPPIFTPALDAFLQTPIGRALGLLFLAITEPTTADDLVRGSARPTDDSRVVVKQSRGGSAMFTPGDMARLRGDAPKTTHLARYDAAKSAKAQRVLHVACPDCGARPDHLCKPMTS